MSEEERERAIARLELGFLQGLESVGGRAEQIGFYQTVLDDPAGSLTRLDALRRVTRQDLVAATERFLSRARRTAIVVDPEPGGDGDEPGGENEAPAAGRPGNRLARARPCDPSPLDAVPHAD